MKTLLSLFCLVTYLTCALSANSWPVSLDMACNKALSAVACSFEFTNNANQDLYLLKRNTPLEGLNSQFVSVSLDGRPLEYEGIYAYRLPPTKDEFVLLKAGESISASVQITDAFNIDTDGLYTVQYSRPLQYLSVNEMSAMSIGKLRESIVRKSVQLYLDGTRLLFKPPRPNKKLNSIKTQSCSTATFLNGDRKNKETLKVHQKLCAGTDTAKANVKYNEDYRTWFGQYTCYRANKVKYTYYLVKDLLQRNDIEYYNNGPKCEANMIAYANVYWTTIYLCDKYYDLPADCASTEATKEMTILSFLGKITNHCSFLAASDNSPVTVEISKMIASLAPDMAIEACRNIGYFYCDSQ
ncbi:PREDICTED: uncharacterized protein LOC109585313 [Amphimedon queenslandica]|uniref:Lysine-specific metallo-endopeptidase domain-containing protein n=1 Tax=Amphimedon queenslandica TaxID=400682 RepID=A0A1X7U018_AMPQE|nr:PREDICTED: uncharacterized protein LOC109585313 [Amphimedon queenslandica]|eukprot:XP_019856887.1 PREDICTED: uncharacterized protein LOC109585313 [Amphimedon queenslandica]